jgi:hypothetical protein
MCLDEGAERRIDPGLIAGSLSLEPGQQVGVEAKPDLLAHRFGAMGLGVLMAIAGNVGPIGSLVIATLSSASVIASTRAQSVWSSPRAVIARSSAAV